MEQSRSSEAYSRWDGQEITRLLCNPLVPVHISKNPVYNVTRISLRSILILSSTYGHVSLVFFHPGFPINILFTPSSVLYVLPISSSLICSP